MKTLYEGILGDIEDNLKAADDYAADLAKAEADWKKLLKTKRTFQVMGNLFVGVKIKSPELARYLMKAAVDDDYYNMNKNRALYVYIVLNYVDCLYPDPDCDITIQVNDNTECIVQNRIKYLTVNDCKDLDKQTGNSLEIPLKTCYMLLLDKMQNSKLLQKLQDVKNRFSDNAHKYIK